MRCIIVDDEPIARIGMKKLVEEIPVLEFIDDFEDAESASEFLQNNEIDLIFGDIQMPGINGIDFNCLGQAAKTVSNPKNSSPADEELAGKVLSENKYTGLVKSMQDDRLEYARRITELIDRHEQKLAEGQNQEVKTSRKKQKLYDSDEFKNFNIDKIRKQKERR